MCAGPDVYVERRRQYWFWRQNLALRQTVQCMKSIIFCERTVLAVRLHMDSRRKAVIDTEPFNGSVLFVRPTPPDMIYFLVKTSAQEVSAQRFSI